MPPCIPCDAAPDGRVTVRRDYLCDHVYQPSELRITTFSEYMPAHQASANIFRFDTLPKNQITYHLPLHGNYSNRPKSGCGIEFYNIKTFCSHCRKLDTFRVITLLSLFFR